LAALAPAYRPRRPTQTVLYVTVREHLETFLAHARDSYSAPLPRYVEEELRGYLRCGVFAHGFVMCRCDACGHELLVAFSCKARAICPSCAGRRMANVAAHLVDRVIPAVPVRQWVLSLPFERALRDDPGTAHADAGGVEAPPREDGAVDLDGFNLHASVAIGADDDLGRERLSRLCRRLHNLAYAERPVMRSCGKSSGGSPGAHP
jgi:hypothetical protein